MMKNLLSGVLLVCSVHLTGQNLILNPGFEEHGEIAGNSPANDNLRINHVTKWLSPTIGSPDYYNRTSEYLTNNFGAPKSHSGDAMAGMAVYDGKRNQREYIMGELSQPLEAGTTYNFSIAIALASTSGFYVGELGVYFSSDMLVKNSSILPLKLIPQLIIDSTDQNGLYGKWMVFHETYVASGGEKFLTIGNFLSDKKTKGKDAAGGETGGFPYAYYYIDDLSLTIAGSELPSDTTKVKVDVVLETPKDTLGIKAGKTLVADNVYFETDKSILKEESFPILDAIIAAMKDQPNLKVEIDGHTDTDGSDEHNLKLSQDRAKAVAAYFVSKGIDPARITTKGYGRSRPIVVNGEVIKDKSRRVEFLFTE